MATTWRLEYVEVVCIRNTQLHVYHYTFYYNVSLAALGAHHTWSEKPKLFDAPARDATQNALYCSSVHNL